MLYTIARQTLLLSVFGLLSFNISLASEMASPSMLSDTCLGCHGPSGISDGPATPTISGMSEIYLIGAMLAYKYDNDEDKVDAVIEADPDLEDVEYFARTSTVMDRIAKGYTEAEIKAIAKYFAALPFKAQKQDVNVEQAQAGASIHENHCEKCHEDGGRSAEDDAGVLAGQWIPYLEYTMADFFSGDRAMPKKMKKQMKEVHEMHGENSVAELIQFYANQE
ncbi:MAG: cytochrome c4 [Gammaproteobacteria bacterium]|nr:cytochrome c4 [Gammaproteobacteria bacterium]